MLELKNLHVYYGTIEALKGISLKVEKREIVTLIGANGSGKTTTLRAISGLIKDIKGDILFKGKSLIPLAPHQIVGLGISQVPEGRRIFGNLTVKENLLMGAFLEKNRKVIAERMDKVFSIFPRLKEREEQLGGTLSGGEQQMLAIGRALMANPEILLLDEPSLGLAPFLVQEIFRIIQEINEMGTTILLVEQNAHLALKISGRAYVLEVGRLVMEGSSAELAENEEVRKAYLGL